METRTDAGGEVNSQTAQGVLPTDLHTGLSTPGSLVRDCVKIGTIPLIPYSITSGSAHLEILSYCVLCTVSRSSCKYVTASPRGAPRRAASRPRPPGVLTRRGGLELASTTPPSRRTCGRGSLRCVPPRAAGAPVTSRTSHDHRKSASQLGSWTCTYTCTRPCVHSYMCMCMCTCGAPAPRPPAAAAPRRRRAASPVTRVALAQPRGGRGLQALARRGCSRSRARGCTHAGGVSSLARASRSTCYLPYISPYISPISPIYLPYVSLHLPYISPASRAARAPPRGCSSPAPSSPSPRAPRPPPPRPPSPRTSPTPLRRGLSSK